LPAVAFELAGAAGEDPATEATVAGFCRRVPGNCKGRVVEAGSWIFQGDIATVGATET
jgi:hypothetical protein